MTDNGWETDISLLGLLDRGLPFPKTGVKCFVFLHMASKNGHKFIVCFK